MLAYGQHWEEEGKERGEGREGGGDGGGGGEQEEGAEGETAGVGKEMVRRMG